MNKNIIKDALEWKGRMVRLLENTKNKEFVTKHIDIIDGLLSEIERYREALEFYADEGHWIEYPAKDDYVIVAPNDDGGEVARLALGVKE